MTNIPDTNNRGQKANYVTHDSIQPGDRVIIVCRKSGSSTKEKNKKLKQYLSYMYQEVLKRGAVVVGVEVRAISANDRRWLRRLGVQARRKRAKLVAHRLDRFIRHPEYDTKNNYELRPRDEDLQNLRSWTRGVELVTLLNPDASWEEERSAATKVGQITSSPGWKKQVKELRQPIAVQLEVEGLSLRQISLRIGVPHSTVDYWLKQAVQVS